MTSLLSRPMSITVATAELSECERLVQRLHKMCCDPKRSPRLMAVEESMSAVRSQLSDGSQAALLRAMDDLDAIGSQIGSLQVACCAPPRMPLYAETLRRLNLIRNDVASQLGLGH